MHRIMIAATLLPSLVACSTIDVTLEKGEGMKGVHSVSVVAMAPASTPIQKLILKANFAMSLACRNGRCI